MAVKKVKEWKQVSVSLSLSTHNNHISLPLRHPTFLSFLSPVSAKEIANVKKCHPVWQMSASASPVASLPQILWYFFLAFWTKKRCPHVQRGCIPKLPHPKQILDSSLIRKVLLSAIRLSVIYDDEHQNTDSLPAHTGSYSL